MSAKKKASPLKDISPVLFFSDEGVPMRFYVRPGPSKQKLAPLIAAGGGLLASAQQPTAILLVDPQERSSIPKTSANWYVSMQYIWDCVDREAQLDIDDYRLNPEEDKPSNTSASRALLQQGRMKYTPEEDAAISQYIRQYQGVKTRGNRIWQQMEKERLTSHPWQSMKDRYVRHISKRDEEGAGGAGGEETSKPDTLSLTPGAPLTAEPAADPPERRTPEPAASHAGPASPESEPSQSIIRAGPEPSPGSFSPTRSVVQPVRKSLRRRLSMDGTPPGPSGKKLRSTPSRADLGSPPTHAPAERSPEEEKGHGEDRGSSGEARAAERDPESEEPPGPQRTPGVLEPQRTPGVLEPQRTPGDLEPQRTPGVLEPQRTPGVLEPPGPQRTRGVLELAAAEFGDMNEMEPTEDDVAPPDAPVARADPKPGPSHQRDTSAAVEPVLATSEAHLFIFDSETQVEGSGPAADAQRSQDEGLALTQVQLDEDVLRIRELMKQAGQDLASVTKALLQMSGDFSEALALLTGSLSAPPPLWTRHDDQLLRAADPQARSRLQRRYGEQSVAKRMLFLGVEG
ncbi:telomeric repeat-binding factor 2-interacting protein 1 [Neosynchiropus ocellatus]